MYLIVGLGNPGTKYQYNRHNVGFMAVDTIAARYSFSKEPEKFKAQVFKGTIDSKKVIAIKPMTFMNDSGKAVSAFINFYKIDIEKVIVLHDELDLTLGKVRLNIGGGVAGHNGLKSINSMVANKYARIRIGIDHPGNRDLVSRHVLQNFSKEEAFEIEIALSNISDLFPDLLEEGYDSFTSNINQLQKKMR
ncbi:MAG: aminoacyl-tRNA hydrolase [Alphaproteobacteria bacterium]|nr:aminoacyl-tRNA hydrolase [Alphaproteobacteria bacterium]